ncbi:MAG: bile acid:sodium symporter [Fusobacteria bacterium]|nr:bile acid:sodium symporter [Fusobacteriota bacterium]
MKALIMPIGIVISILLGLLFPNIATFLTHNSIDNLMIVVMFIIYGIKINFKDFDFSPSQIRIIILAIILNLIVAPFICKFIGSFGLSTYFLSGLLLVSLTPPTLASSVLFSEASGGEVPTSILLTVILNFVSIITIPIMLGIIIPVSKGHSVSMFFMFVTLVVLILIPYVAGMIFAKIKKLKTRNIFIKFGPMVALFIIVFASLGSSKSSIFQLRISELLWLIFMALIINLAFFLIIFLVTNILKVPTKASKALIFSCGTKTLPMSLILIGLMAFPNADAIVAAIVYYFTQLISGSIVAALLHRYKKFKRIIHN